MPVLLFEIVKRFKHFCLQHIIPSEGGQPSLMTRIDIVQGRGIKDFVSLLRMSFSP